MSYERPRRTVAEQAEVDRKDRRQFWIIAVIFTIAMVTMTSLYVGISNAVRSTDPVVAASEQVDRPALPIPDGGQEPTDSGDRGGAGQLVLMGGLAAVLAGGTAWVIHSSRRARRQITAEGSAAVTDAPETTGAPLSATAGSPETR